MDRLTVETCHVCHKPRDERRWETYSNRPGDDRPVCPECVMKALDDVLAAMRALPPEAWEDGARITL